MAARTVSVQCQELQCKSPPPRKQETALQRSSHAEIRFRTPAGCFVTDSADLRSPKVSRSSEEFCTIAHRRGEKETAYRTRQAGDKQARRRTGEKYPRRQGAAHTRSGRQCVARCLP